MTAVETTKERWLEVEVNRVAGEISLKSPKPDAAKAEGYFDRAAGAAGSAALYPPYQCPLHPPHSRRPEHRFLDYLFGTSKPWP
jgi:hypothetical protein